MDTEYRKNRKDWFRLDSFLGWQGLYVFPKEAVLTTPPYLETYSYACCTVHKAAGVIFVVWRNALILDSLFKTNLKLRVSRIFLFVSY